MSRVGKQPITVPANVTVDLGDGTVRVTGPKGELSRALPKRISKPGLRVYARASRIPRVFGGLGTAILSTPQGVMSGTRARRLNVGGEVLAHVW